MIGLRPTAEFSALRTSALFVGALALLNASQMMQELFPTWNWLLFGPPYFFETVETSDAGTPAMSKSSWFFSIWRSAASPSEFGKLWITIWFGLARR